MIAEIQECGCDGLGLDGWLLSADLHFRLFFPRCARHPLAIKFLRASLHDTVHVSDPNAISPKGGFHKKTDCAAGGEFDLVGCGQARWNPPGGTDGEIR